MPAYEYKVVPAPVKGMKAKGVKTGPGRFALTLETLMNELGAQGWEYVRADMLPCDERSGLTGSTTTYMNMLVFRRSSDSVIARLPGEPAVSAFAPAPPQTRTPKAAPVSPTIVSAPELSEDVSQTQPSAHVTPFPQTATPRMDAPQVSTSDAAAAAAAAALTAYRESQSTPRVEDDDQLR